MPAPHGSWCWGAAALARWAPETCDGYDPLRPCSAPVAVYPLVVLMFVGGGVLNAIAWTKLVSSEREPRRVPWLLVSLALWIVIAATSAR